MRPGQGGEEARATLVEYPSADMVAWQVSRRLYANKTFNDSMLIAPVVQERDPTRLPGIIRAEGVILQRVFDDAGGID